MAYKTWAAGDVLTAADVNAYLMKQTVVVCTSATQPASPPTGMVIFETDTNKLRVYTGAAWSTVSFGAGALSTWTPTITQSTTVAGTVGEATYQRIGRWVTGTCYWTASAAGTSANTITCTLPVAPKTTGYNSSLVGMFRYTTGATNLLIGYCEIASASSLLRFRYSATSGNTAGGSSVLGVSTGAVTVTNFAIASGDILTFNFGYEAAADA